MNTKEALIENERRLRELLSDYDPLTGEGSPIERFEFRVFEDPASESIFLPMTMHFKWGGMKSLEENVGKKLLVEACQELIYDRLQHDFEYWAFTTARITDKLTAVVIPFKLNLSQRDALKEAEIMRVNKIPIRAKCLKGRQVGYSTFWHFYTEWIQLVLKMRWNSTIVADVEGQARNIRAMYTLMLSTYPLGRFELTPFAGDSKNRIIEGRGCVVSIGSFQKPNSLRSFDLKIGQFSEVGFWKATHSKTPEDIITAISSAIPYIPDTLIVEESTPNGLNYFYESYMSSKKGDSLYKPIYSPWFRNPINITQFKNDEVKGRYLESMSQQDLDYWEMGASIEGLLWWNSMFQQVGRDDRYMKQEFSGNEKEAFMSTGSPAFDPSYVANVQAGVDDPKYVGDVSPEGSKGEVALKDIKFVSNPKGRLKIWKVPNEPKIPEGKRAYGGRYLVILDIGGISKNSDNSTLTVIDRYWMHKGGDPEIVAEWIGHLDPDLMAWKAAQLGMFYHDGEVPALLVIESNTYETKHANTEGDHSYTVLDQIITYYPNFYTRQTFDQLTQKYIPKPGWHTNKKTKPMIVDHFRAMLRQDEGEYTYIERSEQAIEELYYLEIKDDGSIGAMIGQHDDLAIGRLIGCWIATSPESSMARFEIVNAVSNVDKTKANSGSMAKF